MYEDRKKSIDHYYYDENKRLEKLKAMNNFSAKNATRRF
jgi:hypothetical protein